MRFVEKTTGAASFEIKGFTPKGNKLEFPTIKVLPSSFKRNTKKFWQTCSLGILTIFVLVAAVTFLFPDSPKRLPVGSLVALTFICLLILVWYPLQHELFAKRGMNDFKFLISEQIGMYAVPVQEWTKENGVEISDTTAQDIITTFWELDKPYNPKAPASAENPRFLVIPFQDITGDSYALVPSGKHYELMKTVTGV